MPFNIPYGAPISLSRAQAAVAAVTAEAEKHGWALNVAVCSILGPISLAFEAAWTGGQLGSIAVSEHKARTAARVPPRDQESSKRPFQKGNNYPLAIDDVIVVHAAAAFPWSRTAS